MSFTIKEMINIIKYQKILFYHFEKAIIEKKSIVVSKSRYDYDINTNTYTVITPSGKICENELDVICHCSYYDIDRYIKDKFDINSIITTNDFEKLIVLSKHTNCKLFIYDFEKSKFLEYKQTIIQSKLKSIIESKLPFKITVDNYLISCNYINGKYQLIDLLNYITSEDIDILNYYKLMEKI